MARAVQNHNLRTRQQRLKLPEQKEPHWEQLLPGLHLGYYRPGHTWWVRSLKAGTKIYCKAKLGVADDHAEADRSDVLDFYQAQEKAKEWQRQLAGPRTSAPVTLADAIGDYLEWFKLNGKSLRDTSYAIHAHILPKLGAMKLVELNTEILNKWLAGLAKEPIRNRGKRIHIDLSDPEMLRRRKATANRILTVLKAALNYAYREGKAASDDAWRRVKPFRSVDAAKIRYLSVAEAQRLLNGCDPDFRDLVRGALLTGCRYGELTKMTVNDYTATAGAIHVRDPKSRQSRHVPLTDEGREWFERWIAGRLGDAFIFTRSDGLPWDRAHQSRRMKDACARASIEPALSFHELRHTYASFLATAGVSDQVIAAALGHSDTRMTVKHYAHLKPSYVADTLRAHLPNLGGTTDNVKCLSR